MSFAFSDIAQLVKRLRWQNIVSESNLNEQTVSLYHFGFPFKGIRQHFFKLLVREAALREAEGLEA